MDLATVLPIARRAIPERRAKRQVIHTVTVNVARTDAPPQLVTGTGTVHGELLFARCRIAALSRLERPKKDIRFTGVRAVVSGSIREGGGKSNVRHAIAVKVAAGDRSCVIPGVRTIKDRSPFQRQLLRGRNA
jgi:hypothetical protein